MNHTRYTVHFSGQSIATVVTDMPHVVDDWVHEIRQMGQPLIVGLDCEWRPHPIPNMSNKVATLQLCTQNKCLIAQLSHMNRMPEFLKAFLRDPTVTFVGIGVDKDAWKLRNEYGLEVATARDLEPLAVAHKDWVWYGRRPGLKHFAFTLCGLRMEKPLDVTKSNWEARVLTERQVEYGCIDAYASYRPAVPQLVCYLLFPDV